MTGSQGAGDLLGFRQTVAAFAVEAEQDLTFQVALPCVRTHGALLLAIGAAHRPWFRPTPFARRIARAQGGGQLSLRNR